jgi:phthiodiolone/phenolphthiodiolone dimycocerosates ketoreductase
LSGARLDLRAAAGNRPSIWIGAHGPRMLRLTGRYGDGWYPADVVDPDAYAVRLVEVRRAADRAGRDPATIVPAGELVVIARETDAAAEAELASSDARLAGLLLPATAWSERGLRHPLGATFRGFVDFEPAASNRAAAELVPPELVGDHVLWGSPATIGRKVGALAGAGLRHVNLNFGPITEELVDGASVARVVDAIRAATRPIR